MYLHQNKGDFLLPLDSRSALFPPADAGETIYYSHSIVEGGFDEMS